MPVLAQASGVDNVWIALVCIYFVIVLWAVFIFLIFWRIARGKESQSPLPSLSNLSSLDESCFSQWHWRGRLIDTDRTFKMRCGFCGVDLLLTIGTIIWRICSIGFVQGLAEQFSYLTQWGIMLSATYFGAVCVYSRRQRRDLVNWGCTSHKEDVLRLF